MLRTHHKLVLASALLGLFVVFVRRPQAAQPCVHPPRSERPRPCASARSPVPSWTRLTLSLSLSLCHATGVDRLSSAAGFRRLRSPVAVGNLRRSFLARGALRELLL
jgi:hypothetical protein